MAWIEDERPLEFLGWQSGLTIEMFYVDELVGSLSKTLISTTNYLLVNVVEVMLKGGTEDFISPSFFLEVIYTVD